ncbi:MAG: hypothetical protein AB1Z19_01855 [Eubacteriales bacterium]
MRLNLFTSNSKTKHLRQALLFVALFALLAFGFGKMLEAMYNQNIKSTDFYPYQRYAEYNTLPEDSIDLVFIGSSHAYRSFDAEQFEKALNTRAFNMGSSAQMLDTSYYILEDILLHHSPSTVVLEVNFVTLKNDHYINQNLYSYDYMRPSNVKDTFWKDVFTFKDKAIYSFKILRYRKHLITWLTNVTKSDKTPSSDYYKGKGFVYSEAEVSEDYLVHSNLLHGYDYQGASKVQMAYLAKIIDVCEKNDINLVLVTTPFPKYSLSLADNYSLFTQEMNEISAAYDIPYIDYNLSEDIIFDDSLFADSDHLNGKGAEKLGALLISYLQSLSYY